MVYWVVSVPLVESQGHTRNLLQSKLKFQNLADVSSINLPTLKIGTLDSLLGLSDDLVKINAAVESAVMKMRRTLIDLSPDGEEDAVTVDGNSTEEFVRGFQWNEARYSPRKNLREIVDKIVEEVTKLEDDLKAQMAEYNSLKGSLSAITRKHQGSLVVKDLHTILEEHRRPHVDTENLQALYVVVAKYSVQEFLHTYTKLVDASLGRGSERFSGVVPGSSKLIASDNDYSLYQVTVFKRIAEDFKIKARAKGLQVREYKPPVEGEDQRSPETLQSQMLDKQQSLRQWLSSAFTECFSGFMHLLMIRVFVESILRYGLPPQYQAAVLKPVDKAEAKVRAVLASDFGRSSASLWAATPEDARAGLMANDEIYPYVSYNIMVA